MKNSTITSLGAALGLSLLSSGAFADGLYYEVTITNSTRGQIFSPPLVVTHPANVALFEQGQPASTELAALAQDGNAAPLAQQLEGLPGVQVTVAFGPMLPGETITLDILASHPRAVLSVAGMLVTTNDAFFAIDGEPLPVSRRATRGYDAPAYDAGAEPNDELCAYIPGPPCGNPNAASGLAPEGYVHTHAGIHGIGDLNASETDWRNPVAEVRVRRVNQ